MAERTPTLDLIKEYLEDFGDKRVEHHNWDILDRLFHPEHGHTHDGVDSPLIDLDSVWRAIEELYTITRQLRIDLNSLDVRERQHYLEYIKHKHYDLDAPPSIETHWYDAFNSFDMVDLSKSTVSISTQNGLLHLPANYIGNKEYYYTSKPFVLAHTQVENPNPDIQPQQANARILMARKGTVTPYLLVGNDLQTNTNDIPYAGAQIGSQKNIYYTDSFISSKYTYQGKQQGSRKVPHYAYHFVDVSRPTLSSYFFGKNRPRRSDMVEFSTQDYDRITKSDGLEVTTSPKYQGAEPIYKVINQGPDPRVLYHADKALAWQRKSNTFYWYNADTNTFTQIPDEDIEPLTHPNLANVGAILDPADNWIWVLRSWNVQVTKPQGYFDQMHQLIKWNGSSTFEEGPTWRSGRHLMKHWPANTISPGHLGVDENNVYPITHMSFNYDVAPEGEQVVNYYEPALGQTFDSYQWFPFASIYGDLHKSRTNVTFTKFNPGVLGTVHKISKSSNWVAEGPAKVIKGAYNPTQNQWAVATEEKINDFEGGNDNVYLGTNGDELFFYQSFVPYNGADIHRNERWKNSTFRQNNPDTAWYGIIAYNIGTGISRFIRGDVPFRVNIGGGITPEGGEAYLMGGTELIKQFVTNDMRIVATDDNQPPDGTPTIYSYWVDRHIPGVVLPNRRTIREDIINPIRVDLNDGTVERVTTYSEDISLGSLGSRTQMPQVVMYSGGLSCLGGKSINNREAIRLRRIDGKVRKIVGWKGALKHGSMARQIYIMELGENITDRDVVKIYMKARAEGKPATTSADSPRVRDIDVWTRRPPDWYLLGRIANGDGDVVFQMKDPEIIANRRLVFMIESKRTTDRRAKIPSKLHVDYVYATIERQGYVYEYEWTDVPDGNKGVVMLDCHTGTRYGQNPGQGLAVGHDNDIYGVEVEQMDLSIVSNIEG